MVMTFFLLKMVIVLTDLSNLQNYIEDVLHKTMLLS